MVQLAITILILALVALDLLLTRYAVKKAEQRGFEKGLRMNTKEVYE